MIDPRQMAASRQDSERAERFQYAQLNLQIINSLKEPTDVPFRDEVLRQAGANLLAWLNRTGSSSED